MVGEIFARYTVTAILYPRGTGAGELLTGMGKRSGWDDQISGKGEFSSANAVSRLASMRVRMERRS